MMFRNSLFIRLCVSFWLATLLLIGTIVTVDWLTGSGPFRSDRPWPLGPLSFSGPTLAWIYEREGPAGLQAFARRLHEKTGTTIRFWDEGGREVTKTPALQGSAGIPDRAVPETEPPGEWKPEEKVAVRGDGKTYAFSVGHPPPLPGGPHKPFPMIVVRLLAALLVSALLCYLFARYLAVPILRLSEATRRFAAGELSVRAPASLKKGRSEMVQLAADFDLMAERIEGLLRSQRTLLRDISHELRSPLARLNVALALCRTGPPREASRCLDRIEREADRINEMIGHLLTLNRAEAGLNAGGSSQIDLAGLVREIGADAAFEAEGQGRRVAVRVPEVCSLEGDEELLRRAIDNVARNAVRYTGEGTTVEIVLAPPAPGSGDAVLTVRDRGPGAPEDALPHLFTPFYRVGNSRERETGGTGLGLAITEAAVRLHGGRVEAANADGGGLLVTLTLPCRGGAALSELGHCG